MTAPIHTAVRLQLHPLACFPGNIPRPLATPEPIKDWPLASPMEKLIETGAKIVSHGCFVAFQMAEAIVPENLFAGILDRRSSTAARSSACVKCPAVRHSSQTHGRDAS
ncbi:MAG: hypothetical protein WBF43_06200 [Methylocella sp.]